MKVGSLFSGYGGLDLAVGGELAWYSEIEAAACMVMEAHHPGVPNLGDITTVDWSQVEPVDLITGGYPCQPFSNAGMRKGTKDERHLWPHVRDALRAIRPRYAVLENVRGHLTLGFDVVLTDLADLGWSARWGVVRAADAGAPHHRARLFIIAYPEREGLQGQPWTWLGWASESAESGDDAANTQGGRWGTRAGLATTQTRQQGEGVGDFCIADTHGAEWRTAQPDDLQARGTAEPGERASTATNPSSKRHGSGEGPTGVGRVGGSSEGSRRQASAARQEPGAGSVEDVANANSAPRKHSVSGVELPNAARCDWGAYAPAIDRWQHVIGRPAPAPTIRRAERDRLNPAFVEWMMGLPEGWVTGHGLSASQELKMLGNGVVPQQARLALQLLGGVA